MLGTGSGAGRRYGDRYDRYDSRYGYANDRDCDAVCGDGHIGAGETCDPPSTCPASCPDDGDPCTREQLTGDASACSAVCRHAPITACSGALRDSCCPTGCSSTNDPDC